MALRVETFVGGPLETNAYLVRDEGAGEAIIIDAPDGVTEAITAAAARAATAVRRSC